MPERVLVVDDDHSLRQLAARVLRSAGYETDLAPTGDAAFRLLGESRYTALVTDLVMPDMDGLELIRKIRATDQEVAIVAMSGGGATVTMDFLPSAQAFGADGILRKPLRPKPFIDAVETAIQRRKDRAE